MKTIKCPNCGEEYSTIYKRCPFCEERPTTRSGKSPQRGGKRVATNTRGGGYGKHRGRESFMRVFGLLLSVVLIVAAICIVVSVVRALFSGEIGPSTVSEPPVSVQPSQIPSEAPSEAPSAAPVSEAPVSAAPVSEAPAVSVNSITLNKADFTLTAIGATYQLTAAVDPAGTAVTWTSSNTAVITVDQTGKVTVVGAGNSTITAAAGNKTATCIVRARIEGQTPTPASAAPVTVTALTLKNLKYYNTADFQGYDISLTLAPGKTYTFVPVTVPAGGSVTWKSSNSAVATVSGTGVLTVVGYGNATITATAGSVSVNCVVRIKQA